MSPRPGGWRRREQLRSEALACIAINVYDPEDGSEPAAWCSTMPAGCTPTNA